jgi:Ca2+-binding EF-hand superfamily protein
VWHGQALRARFELIDLDKSGTIDMGEFMLYALRDTLQRSGARVVDLLARWGAC